MIIKAEQVTGKGKFTCTKCGSKVIISSNDEILNRCKSCSNDEFEGDVTFERSELNLKNKFEEVILILETSVFLYEAVGISAFINVVASQLRLLLCDTFKGEDISLLPKVFNSVKFHPCKNEYVQVGSDNPDNKMIISGNLFDYQAQTIDLNSWLEQEIIFCSDEKSPIKIKEIIKYAANKHGGAHIDEELMGRELFTITLSDSYLVEIGKYIIKWLDRDILWEVHDKFVKEFFVWYHKNGGK